MSWFWRRRRNPFVPIRATGRASAPLDSLARLGDNDTVPLAGHRRYVDLLRPTLDDSPLMTRGQVARTTPVVKGGGRHHVPEEW